MENTDHGSQLRCFREWMNLQEIDLEELLRARNLTDGDIGRDRTAQLTELVEKNIRHFQEYITKRASLARDDISPYFSPTWCTSLEGSMLWAGGCRPSIFMRLLYALCGKDINEHLHDYLNEQWNNELGWLSARQISLVNDLQLKTIRQEDKLSSKLASLQEEIVDQPMAIIVEELRTHSEDSLRANEVLNAHAVSMMGLLEEADNLRLETLKELIGVLTPDKAIHFLLRLRSFISACTHGVGGGILSMGGTDQKE